MTQLKIVFIVRVVAAKRAYKNGPDRSSDSKPERRSPEAQADAPSSRGNLQDDVYAILPADGAVMTIDEVMAAVRKAGVSADKASVIAALSVLVTRKHTVTKPARGKYSREIK